MLLLRDRQDQLKCTSHRTSHVLGTQNRSVIALEPSYALFEILRPPVVVKGNYVSLFQLNVLRRSKLLRRRSLALPNSTGKRLRRMGGASPDKDVRQKSQHQF